ncbi:MAG: putative DNA binding domain-containing protein [Gammaproteobacteria bacterium]|nr:putative DNA binding domain-containing protein [Gammaproteobacteria bacterium]
MEWLEVLRHIEVGEASQTEFKRGLGDFSGVGRTICAFANGDGGLLILGVVDPGGIVGVGEDPNAVQERLTSFLHSGCGRPVTAECGRELTDNGWVHWVHVRRHQRGYEPFSVNGRFWVRRGRASVAPSPSELQELFNAFGLVLTEQQTIASATAKDIDLDAFRSFMLAQGKRMEGDPQPEIESDLRNASVCDLLDQIQRPTLYGLMVFGRDPQGHPHTASLFVQCAAYDGTDRASPVLSVGEGKGRLDEQVTRSAGWFRSLGRKETYPGLHRRDISLVPEDALREALVNAVIHRDYTLTGSQVFLEVFEDRIDVTSPGTLPNHMTVDQARSGGTPRSRNEMMANAMVVRRLMERRGRGWLLMRHAMRAFNGTEPDLVNDRDGRFVRVTFHLKRNASVGE